MRLENKVAIITGGAGGIGQETCNLFAQEGAKLLIAEANFSAAEEVAKNFSAKGFVAKAIEVDVTNFNDAKKMVDRAIELFGHVDILANIAGGSAGPFIKTKYSFFHESTVERWNEIINLNLYGTMNCCHAALRHMVERKCGKIVNLSSLAGMIGMQKAAEYAAAKAAIVGFTKSVAKELACAGYDRITLNCVSPGVIGTKRIRNQQKDVIDGWLSTIPCGRLGEPKDIANAILFLASSESDYITGENIPVTGGQSLGTKGY